jgi:hypothetical protein
MNHYYEPQPPTGGDYNGWADFWCKDIGVNVFPANNDQKAIHKLETISRRTDS